MTKITYYTGFRELLILYFLMPDIYDENYIRKQGSSSLEKAIDNNNAYEVIYRLWLTPPSNFQKNILIARSIRMKKWNIIRSLVDIFKTQPFLWNIYDSVKNGVDKVTLSMMINRYEEPIRERIRPICLLYSENANNVEVFVYILTECDIQRRRKGQIRKIMKKLIENI